MEYQIVKLLLEPRLGLDTLISVTDRIYSANDLTHSRDTSIFSALIFFIFMYFKTHRPIS